MSTRLRKNRKLAIIVPAYNAAQTLVSTIERIPQRAWDNTAKVFIINDGSTDSTSGAAQLLADAHDCIEVVEHPGNLGYGAAMRQGMKVEHRPANEQRYPVPRDDLIDQGARVTVIFDRDL